MYVLHVCMCGCHGCCGVPSGDPLGPRHSFPIPPWSDGREGLTSAFLSGDEENDVWIKVNTPKAFLLNQRDLRKGMLIATKGGGKIPLLYFN